MGFNSGFKGLTRRADWNGADMKCAPNFGKETSRETPTCKPKGMSGIMMD